MKLFDWEVKLVSEDALLFSKRTIKKVMIELTSLRNFKMKERMIRLSSGNSSTTNRFISRKRWSWLRARGCEEVWGGCEEVLGGVRRLRGGVRRCEEVARRCEEVWGGCEEVWGGARRCDEGRKVVRRCEEVWWR